MTVGGKILALIPARSGSKGIPGKNARLFRGLPLLAWAVRAALQSGLPERTIISTDDPHLSALALAAGAEAPFLRPAELSGDHVPMIDVALHALNWLSERDNWSADVLLLLQPTSPLRRPEDIRAAGALLEGADAVVSVVTTKHHPRWVQRIEKDGLLAPYLEGAEVARRQDLDPVYALNGAIYLVRSCALREHRSFHPPLTRAYLMPEDRSVDIDSESDWNTAELFAGQLSAPGFPPA